MFSTDCRIVAVETISHPQELVWDHQDEMETSNYSNKQASKKSVSAIRLNANWFNDVGIIKNE